MRFHWVKYNGVLIPSFVKIFVLGLQLSSYIFFQSTVTTTNIVYIIWCCTLFASELTASPFIVLGSKCRVSPCGSCWFCMCNSSKLRSSSSPSVTVTQLYPKYLQTHCTAEFGIIFLWTVSYVDILIYWIETHMNTDEWSLVQLRIMDTSTSFISIFFFAEAFKNGNGSKFWSYIWTNTEPFCRIL
jgi:hypothetical protein